MAAFLITRTCDLKKPLRVEALETALFTGDENAHEIEIAVQDGGENVALSGHVYGYFIRSDGMTVDHEGTISGNKVSVILPASAYYHEGYLDIAINVDTGNEVLTVYAARAFVYRTTSNNYAEIDPTIPIPSLLEILQKIQDCEDATAAANNAAESLEGMDATATGLATGTPPTATVSTVDGHYRIAFGIPAGATGATGATPNMTIGTVETLQEGSQATATITGTTANPVLNLGIPVGATGATGSTGATGATGANGTNGTNATISTTTTEYQASTSGTAVPTGTWSSTIPTVPQGNYLWMRVILTWNNGAQTILYSISRNGVDGSGSVASVNGFSPDGNGNVEVPLDTIPTAQSDLGITSNAVYTALQGKQDTLTFDQLPASASTNPVTSGGIYSALTYKVDKAGDTMSGVLKVPNPEVYDSNYPQIAFKAASNASNDGTFYFDRASGQRRFVFRQSAVAGGYTDIFVLPATTNTTQDQVIDIITGKGGSVYGDFTVRNGFTFNAVSPVMDVTSAPASGSWSQDGLRIMDKNHNGVGFFCANQFTNGNAGIQLLSGRPINGNYVFNGIAFEISPTGEMNVGVSAPRKWREALNGVSVVTRSGSKILSFQTATSAESIVTSAEINAMIGVSDSSPNNTSVFLSNGDEDTWNGTITCAYNNSVGAWRAQFSPACSGYVRVNWLVAYYG